MPRLPTRSRRRSEEAVMRVRFLLSAPFDLLCLLRASFFMIVVTGTIAYDYIMNFPGKFGDHILPDKIHKINLSFNVNKFAKRRGGTAGNVSYSLGLLQTPHILLATAGKDFEEYKKDFLKLDINLDSIKIEKSNYTSTGFAMADQLDNQIWGYFLGASERNYTLDLSKVAKKSDLVLIGPSGVKGSMSFVSQCVKLDIDYMFDPGFILTEIKNNQLEFGIQNAKYIIGNDYEIALIKKRIKNFNKIIKNKVFITTLGEKGALIEALKKIKERLQEKKLFKGLTIAACLHVTSETAQLMIALKTGGARVALCASNPLSTQDEVGASLVKDYGIPTFAIHGEDNATYNKHLDQALNFNPQITLDDGGDLIHLLHTKRKDLIAQILGSAEETTTGVIRLKAMEKDKALQVPVIAVNDSDTKHLFDNRYGTGQSTIDGIIRATNILMAGKNFVVAGYGWCSRGIASRAKGMGANVIVTEVDSVRALEAAMDGFRVMKMQNAAKIGDILVSATGDKHVISMEIIKSLKDGAILANSGHFDVEIDMAGLKKAVKSKRALRNSLEEYVLKNGKKIYILGEGRLVNLAAADGHPAEVMDMSFANQALAVEYFLKNRGKLENKVYVLPKKLDQQVASLKLQAMGISIDKLTREQSTYLSSWTEGTK